MKPDSPVDINPYAPSLIEAEDQSKPIGKPRRDTVGAGNLIWTTIGGVSLSGGVFGLGVVVFGAIGTLAFRGGQGVPSGGDVVFLFIPALMAFAFGMLIASVLAFVIVPVFYLAVVKTNRRDHVYRWTGGRVRIFGGICGFMTGWISIALISSFDPMALAFALIPGAVGLIVTMIVLNPMAKRADRAQQIAADSIGAKSIGAKSIGGDSIVAQSPNRTGSPLVGDLDDSLAPDSPRHATRPAKIDR
ncbi:MAG: hypothetical protein HKN47_13835 [Pirellulaceae bacterium]|nr:hypothetical protein [Pirellulaceae bacterium]